MINYQTNDTELEKFMDVKALRDHIQELHDSGDCGHMLSDILEMANKLCDQPDKPERITKQDAKQIANSVANSRCGSFWEWYKSYGRALLNKLNTERQAPVGVVPDCFLKLYHHARGMRAGTDWNKGIAARNHRQPLIDATRECDTWLASPPRSRQGTDLMEEFAEKLATHLAKKFPYGMSAGDVFAEVKTLLRGNKLCEDQ